ncbi:MAG TPA: sucrase ferredoxin [Acidimicrobiales bacterium]|nr:sucrase ferredoxin [Acidimicrobiales bacterium]
MDALTAVTDAQDFRCSTFSRSIALDPIGTAGNYRGYLLIEWPLPWPRDVGEIPELAPVAAASSAARFRLQALVAGDDPERSVICYFAPRGPFTRYRRQSLRAHPDELVEAALELLRACAREDGVDDAPSALSDPEPAARDVLICTHGRRDRCCGSLGTALVTQFGLAGRAPEGPTAVASILGAAGTTFWRTSHTGGHRFAPTAIVLPEGTVWGYLTADTLRDILDRAGAADAVLAHYRGCAGLASPQLQVLERAVIAERGWEVLDASRDGEVERSNDDGWSLARLRVHHTDGRTDCYEAEVGVGRTVTMPTCGDRLATPSKAEQELTMHALRRIDTTAESGVRDLTSS